MSRPAFGKKGKFDYPKIEVTVNKIPCVKAANSSTVKSKGKIYPKSLTFLSFSQLGQQCKKRTPPTLVEII